MSERNVLLISGDGMLNFKDYVASSIAPRDMYDAPLVATLFKWVISWFLVQLFLIIKDVRPIDFLCPILWFDFLDSY